MRTPCTLPQYRSHKVVRAARVVAIELSLLDLGEHGRVVVGSDWIAHKGAQAGGYYVVYEDGYASFSPAKVFEDGYTAIDPA